MDKIALKIKELLEAVLTTQYKKYFYGENKAPDEKIFPFIEIIPINSEIKNIGTGGMLKKIHTIKINIKNTLKKYLTSNTEKEVIDHIQDLVKRMEDDETSGQPKSTSVIGVLHDNLQLDATANINGDWTVEYTEIPYGESYIVIASVQFTVERIASCI